jgi:hypothetical protein
MNAINSPQTLCLFLLSTETHVNEKCISYQALKAADFRNLFLIIRRFHRAIIITWKMFYTILLDKILDIFDQFQASLICRYMKNYYN